MGYGTWTSPPSARGFVQQFVRVPFQKGGFVRNMDIPVPSLLSLSLYIGDGRPWSRVTPCSPLSTLVLLRVNHVSPRHRLFQRMVTWRPLEISFASTTWRFVGRGGTCLDFSRLPHTCAWNEVRRTAPGVLPKQPQDRNRSSLAETTARGPSCVSGRMDGLCVGLCGRSPTEGVNKTRFPQRTRSQQHGTCDSLCSHGNKKLSVGKRPPKNQSNHVAG